MQQCPKKAAMMERMCQLWIPDYHPVPQQRRLFFNAVRLYLPHLSFHVRLFSIIERYIPFLVHDGEYDLFSHVFRSLQMPHYICQGEWFSLGYHAHEILCWRFARMPPSGVQPEIGYTWLYIISPLPQIFVDDVF